MLYEVITLQGGLIAVLAAPGPFGPLFLDLVDPPALSAVELTLGHWGVGRCGDRGV